MKNEVQKTSFSLVIVGGGAGGTSVAARIKRAKPKLDIVVIDPATYHYYQPAWTLVGGGQYQQEKTRRRLADCLPSGVKLIAQKVASFAPDTNEVVLDDGVRISYKCLLVAAGIQINWDAIAGLTDTLGKNGVTSNYRYDLAPYTWECIRELNSGSALFTQPPMPIKCAGAPQKILYLAADDFRKRKVAADIQFFTPGGSMFGVPFYSKALDKVMADYGAKPQFGYNLVEVDGPNKLAIFEVPVDGVKTRKSIPFTMLHVVPPQSAPNFIRESTLADAAGWLEVDKATLQHVRFKNIFGIGDCTSTPNSKTAAAVKNQTPVAVVNILRTLSMGRDEARYDGYASCPLTTSVGKVMLAEFCYDGVITPSFPADPRVPRKFYWWLKKSFLPFLYWSILTKGRAWPITHRKRAYPDEVPPITP
jgi:sulfide:quinone oxidoreductase